MESSEREDVRRVIEGRVKPFWRFRRRQAIGKALADARVREQQALALLREDTDGAGPGPK